MGLHITSIAEIAPKTEGLKGINYFVYFLNYYQFSSEVVDAFLKEIPALETHFNGLGNALLVTGVKNHDFYSDILSWHNIVGLEAEKVCPCILICTLPPADFGPSKVDHIQTDGQEPWIILELKDYCQTADELITFLKEVVSAISRNEELAFFEEKENFSYNQTPIFVGRPKLYGMSLNFSAILNKTKKRLTKKRSALPPNYDIE